MALCFHSNNAMACHQTRGSIFTARSSFRISPLLHDKKLCAYQTVGQTDRVKTEVPVKDLTKRRKMIRVQTMIPAHCFILKGSRAERVKNQWISWYESNVSRL